MVRTAFLVALCASSVRHLPRPLIEADDAERVGEGGAKKSPASQKTWSEMVPCTLSGACSSARQVGPFSASPGVTCTRRVRPCAVALLRATERVDTQPRRVLRPAFAAAWTARLLQCKRELAVGNACEVS